MRESKEENPRDRSSARLFEEFVAVIERLRKECPWDREQTHESVKHLLIEEAYETLEAIESGNRNELKKELGDLLLHVVFHSVIAEESGSFTIDDVMSAELEKLIRRHPHVFGETEVNGTAEVLRNWERIKQEEGGRRSVVGGTPNSLPSLLRAYRLQEKVAGVGFDFPTGEEAWKKVEEELDELRSLAKAGADPAGLEDEFGDVLFALVNYARFIGVNPENGLRSTNDKFVRRFRFIEEVVASRGQSFRDLNLSEMDEIWDEAKARERR